jgi:rhodanese-related sulfurtransferase
MSQTGSNALIAPAAQQGVYYGWVVLGVAALAMVGTLPGRTQGLGLITEPLLRDLGLSRVTYAQINLVATLVGALFCLGVGRLIDRLGSRIVLTATAAALGLTVLTMSQAGTAIGMLVLVTLTRGLGQSALSVISLAMVGKWFRRRLTGAMAGYALVMSVGFMAAFPLVGAVVQSGGWRTAWAAIGVALAAGLAPLAWWLDRSSPEAIGLHVDGELPSDLTADAGVDEAGATQSTLGEALRSPAFWVFALASSVYGLVASGIGLLNESILAERGFAPAVYYTALAVTAITGLAGNFAAGALAPRVSLRVILVAAMAVLAAGLAALAHVATETQVMGQAVAMGIAGGFVTVVFFSFWGHAYGRRHLGRIQGAAQAMTVVASAIGPLFLAEWAERTGSYAAAFYVLAGIVAVLGAAASLVSIPAGAQPVRRRSDVPAQTLLEQIEANQAPTIVDVRTAREFSQGHVPGAINISFGTIGARTDAIPGSREGVIVVYCERGPRAWIAAAALRRRGFTNIGYLAGHFSKWRAAGLREER